MSRGLSRPLADLDEAAGRMGSGDLSVRASVGSRDEIGRLARSLDQLRTDLTEARGHREQERARTEAAAAAR